MAKSHLANADVIINPGSFPDLRLMRANTAVFPEPATIAIPFESSYKVWNPTSMKASLYNNYYLFLNHPLILKLIFIDNKCDGSKSPEAIKQGSFGLGPWCRVSFSKEKNKYSS